MTKEEAIELINDFTKISGLDKILKSTPLTLHKIINTYIDDPNRTIKFSDDINVCTTCTNDMCYDCSIDKARIDRGNSILETVDVPIDDDFIEQLEFNICTTCTNDMCNDDDDIISDSDREFLELFNDGVV